MNLNVSDDFFSSENKGGEEEGLNNIFDLKAIGKTGNIFSCNGIVEDAQKAVSLLCWTSDFSTWGLDERVKHGIFTLSETINWTLITSVDKIPLFIEDLGNIIKVTILSSIKNKILKIIDYQEFLKQDIYLEQSNEEIREKLKAMIKDFSFKAWDVILFEKEKPAN